MNKENELFRVYRACYDRRRLRSSGTIPNRKFRPNLSQPCIATLVFLYLHATCVFSVSDCYDY